MHQSKSTTPHHKKHNENINKSVQEDNRIRTQFFQINTTC